MLFIESAYLYTVASPSDHIGQEGYWSHIGKKIFDVEDGIYFIILDVCTSNFHSGLFFKYIDCKYYKVNGKRKINIEDCEYSLCKEIMDPQSYQFEDAPVIFFVNLRYKLINEFFFNFLLFSINFRNYQAQINRNTR